MSTAVATLQPTRLPIPGEVAKKFELSQTQWRVLVDQIFPAAKSVEAVVMALEYCRARKLDIFKRPVHIVPVWSSAKKAMVETCWPGIAEIRTTAARTGEYVGMDEIQYGPMITRKFEGVVEQWESGQKVQKKVEKEVTYPEWASVVVYRLIAGQPRAFHTKIYWLETYGQLKGSNVPNDMWQKRPIGQFDKCLEAAALRKAFPEEVGNDLTAEEMEGRVLDHEPTAITPPKPPRPNSAPPKPNGVSGQTTGQDAGAPAKQTPPKPANDQQQESELAGKDVEDAAVDDEIPSFDQETGEVIDEGEADQVEEVKTPSDLLTALDDDMAVAKDEATVLEVWEAHDIEAALTHMEQGDQFAAIARAIRDRSLKRVKGKN